MIMADNLQLLKRRMLGKGSFGSVFFASPVNSEYADVSFAVKSADIKQSSSLQEEENFLYQLYSCPNIVRCFGHDISIENNNFIFNLLLEYAPGGTLADLISRSKNRIFGVLPEHEVGWFTYLLLSGLKDIHEQGYVHCDLKPDNILVFPSEDGTLSNIKIADLGLAKKAGDDTIRPILVNSHWFKHRGTPLYSSPESVLLGIHESPMDIWSLGCVVMEMLTGKPAYPKRCFYLGEDNLEDLLLTIGFKTKLPKIPDDQNNISDNAKDFLRRCLIRNMHERWSAEQLLNHPFIVEQVKLLRGFGAVTEPETVKDASPTVWLSSISGFLDPSTTVQSAACTSSVLLPRPPGCYREALLKELK